MLPTLILSESGKFTKTGAGVSLLLFAAGACSGHGTTLFAAAAFDRCSGGGGMAGIVLLLLLLLALLTA